VTNVDVAVERAIREVMDERRPDDDVVGEELGGPAAPKRRAWVLDPIDGTSSFARGGTVWGTLIALEIDGRPAVGVASMPARSSRWWGAVGVGATASTPDRPEPTPLAASSAVPGGSLRCACVPSADRLAGAEREAALAVTGLGRLVPFAEWTTYPPLMVADGSLEASLHLGAHWDVAALGAVVLAAGGTYHVAPTSTRDRTIALATAPVAEALALDALGWTSSAAG
jgi:histidinol-phosphatase